MNVVTSPDNVIYAEESNGNKRKMFYFFKSASDGNYRLLEVYADKKGNLTSKSFLKNKEGVSQREALLQEPSSLTSVTDGATLFSDAKIPQMFENPKLSD